MGLKGKLIASVEVKCGGHLMHDLLHTNSHHVANISQHVNRFQIHEGESVKVGSIVSWSYNEGGTHGHHPWTVGGPTVRPAGPWFVSATSPRTQPEIRPSVDLWPDLQSVGQVTDRGSCPWIDVPKAQLQS
uniref:Sn-2 protein n=1 Tax=Solanum tuberosum TaxID=4113 RepID=M1AUH0_SOLTU